MVTNEDTADLEVNTNPSNFFGSVYQLDFSSSSKPRLDRQILFLNPPADQLKKEIQGIYFSTANAGETHPNLLLSNEPPILDEEIPFDRLFNTILLLWISNQNKSLHLGKDAHEHG